MNYKGWANILVNHEYLGGKCGDFRFLPDNASNEIMKREGFLMNETSEGFYLIAQESAFTEDISLVFWATPMRQDLWSATLFDGIPKESIPFAKANGDSLQWASIEKVEIPKEMQLPTPMFGIEISRSSEDYDTKITLSLKTKKMKWRYNILGISEFSEPEITGIKSYKDSAVFNVSTDNSGHTVFTSEQEIPLCFGAPPHFQLREKNSTKAIIKCLPNMDARSIATAILEGGKPEIIAETFVNT